MQSLTQGYQVRQFRADTWDEAIRRISAELGPDARLLESRTVWGGWWKGLCGKRQIEVTAVGARCPDNHALQCEPSSAAPRLEVPPPAHLEDYRSRWRQCFARDTLPKGGGLPDTAPPPWVDELDLRLFTELVDRNVCSEFARLAVTAARDESRGEGVAHEAQRRQHLREWLVRQLKTVAGIALRPGQRKVVALVGPTGVGKTTTMAKIAANFRLRDKKKVGLITADTYRIAAVEQLRTYAEIIDLPLEVVTTPREMRRAVLQMEELDVVLIDTAGRSPHDELRLHELRALLREAHPDETHLVLSTHSHPRVLAKTADKFAALGANALILTKLDEADGAAGVWSFLARFPHPLSYTTHGQNVPQDICVADARQLVDDLWPADMVVS